MFSRKLKVSNWRGCDHVKLTGSKLSGLQIRVSADSVNSIQFRFFSFQLLQIHCLNTIQRHIHHCQLLQLLLSLFITEHFHFFTIFIGFPSASESSSLNSSSSSSLNSSSSSESKSSSCSSDSYSSESYSSDPQIQAQESFASWKHFLLDNCITFTFTIAVITRCIFA